MGNFQWIKKADKKAYSTRKYPQVYLLLSKLKISIRLKILT